MATTAYIDTSSHLGNNQKGMPHAANAGGPPATGASISITVNEKFAELLDAIP